MSGAEITNRQLISRETGLTISLVSVLLVATWSVRGFTASVDNRLARIEDRIAEIVASIADAGADRWRGNDMDQWAHRLAELNADLIVPDPSDATMRPIKD